MPKEFKGLVSAIVWIIFIYGCIILINTIVASILGWITPELTMAGGGLAMVSFILAAVAVRIRQKLE